MNSEDDTRISLVLILASVFIFLLTLVFISFFSSEPPPTFKQVEYILPDKTRTPGVSYPLITQDNIKDTICSHGKWRTKMIRPPLEYTQTLKRKQIDEYGYKDKDMRNYEEDHLIPLTLGGHPTDQRNLWPESRLTKPLNAHHKDQVENYLNQEVCAGKRTLDSARKDIATDWTIVYKQMIQSGYIDPWAKRLRREP